MNKKHPLAYVRVIDKLYLPKEYDKRKKLTQKQKEKIRRLYKTGSYTYRLLAVMFSVSYSTIQVTIDEARRIKNLANAQKYRKSGKYKKKPYDSMDIRRRKKELVKKNIIIL